jgi:hypothetical protein
MLVKAPRREDEFKFAAMLTEGAPSAFSETRSCPSGDCRRRSEVSKAFSRGDWNAGLSHAAVLSSCLIKSREVPV